MFMYVFRNKRGSAYLTSIISVVVAGITLFALGQSLPENDQALYDLEVQRMARLEAENAMSYAVNQLHLAPDTYRPQEEAFNARTVRNIELTSTITVTPAEAPTAIVTVGQANNYKIRQTVPISVSGTNITVEKPVMTFERLTN